MLEGHTASVFSAEYKNDGSLIVSASKDDSIRIWDAQTGECLRILEGIEDSVISAAFNLDGLLIVSASFDGSIRIRDA